jgi:hypothetical protein
MNPQDEIQVLSERLKRLEERCRQLHRHCRRLLYTLAAIAVIALATPTVLLICTSCGKELRCRTVTAERIVVPDHGELVMEGREDGQLRARLGYFPEESWFGLAFFDREKHVLRLRGDVSPSLTLGPIHDWKSQLRIGYTGQVEPGVIEVVGEPLIDFVGHRGARRISLSVAGNGDPHFAFWDDDGQNRRLDLSARSNFFSHLTLWDKGQRQLDLSSFPAVELFDRDGKPRARLQFNREPSLLLLDEQGQAVPQK